MSRPRKVRPKLGDDLAPGMSLRDVEAATGTSRKFLATAVSMAAMPAEEFDRIVEGDSPKDVFILGRRRSRKLDAYVRRCPHCGVPLKIEDAR